MAQTAAERPAAALSEKNKTKQAIPGKADYRLKGEWLFLEGNWQKIEIGGLTEEAFRDSL